jgi:hypothetical protein
MLLAMAALLLAQAQALQHHPQAHVATAGDMGDIWQDFVQVCRIPEVLARSGYVLLTNIVLTCRMRELEAANNDAMMTVLGWLKGDQFKAIVQWMWADRAYIDVGSFHFHNITTLLYPAVRVLEGPWSRHGRYLCLGRCPARH